jgi:hypothetical protein
MGAHTDKYEVACQQVLVEDSSVFSIQWSVFPVSVVAGLTPQLLLERYLSYIRRTTCAVIQPHGVESGIEFRLCGSRLSLISFLPPAVEAGAVVLRICGGLLVQPQQCNRGELKIFVEQMAEGTKISLQLSDYCPLILGSSSPSAVRRWLYRLTQAAIHRLVTVRFLVLLYRDLVGHSVRVKLVSASVREGQPV